MDAGVLAYARRGGVVRRHALTPGVTTIGSARDNQLVLDDDAVASRHLRVSVEDGQAWITDLGSATGTMLNARALAPNTRYALRDGDVLRIGPFYLRYSQAAAAGTPPPDPAIGTGPRVPATPATPALTPPDIAGRVPARIAAQLPPGQAVAAAPLRSVARPALPADSVSSYLQYLPALYQNSVFLGRFLLIFESILDPIERSIDQMDRLFDPRIAPEALLPWLATWVDLVLNEQWPLASRRALVRAAAELYRWRGTRRGLAEYLRIYAGVEPIIEEPGPALRGSAALPAHVFRVILELPADSPVERHVVEAIIESEKPAHTAYLLELRTREAS